MYIADLFRNLLKLIKNPNIIDELSDKLARANSSDDRNHLQAVIDNYRTNIDNGLLLEVPNMNNGDTFYYVANGTTFSEKIQEHAILKVYAGRVRYIIKLTLEHYIIRNGILYIVPREDPNILIYAQNPMLYNRFDDALSEIRTLSDSDMAIETITEYTKHEVKNNTEVVYDNFVYPYALGTRIVQKFTVNGEDRYDEYTVIGYNIRSDGTTVVIYNKKESVMDELKITAAGISDPRYIAEMD